MRKNVPLAEVDATLAELEQSHRIVSVTTEGDSAEIVYEMRGNRAAGDVETRA